MVTKWGRCPTGGKIDLRGLRGANSDCCDPAGCANYGPRPNILLYQVPLLNGATVGNSATIVTLDFQATAGSVLAAYPDFSTSLKTHVLLPGTGWSRSYGSGCSISFVRLTASEYQLDIVTPIGGIRYAIQHLGPTPSHTSASVTRVPRGGTEIDCAFNHLLSAIVIRPQTYLDTSLPPAGNYTVSGMCNPLRGLPPILIPTGGVHNNTFPGDVGGALQDGYFTNVFVRGICNFPGPPPSPPMLMEVASATFPSRPDQWVAVRGVMSPCGGVASGYDMADMPPAPPWSSGSFGAYSTDYNEALAAATSGPNCSGASGSTFWYCAWPPDPTLELGFTAMYG